MTQDPDETRFRRRHGPLPRLTRRVFADLAIYMLGFGLVVGVIFPPFATLLGTPASAAYSPAFIVSCLAAGTLVAGVAWGIVALTVGHRISELSTGMTHVQNGLRQATHTGDWSHCNPEECRLPVLSDDALGDCAAAFNGLLLALADSHASEARALSVIEATPDFVCTVAPDGQILYANASAREFLGAEDDAEIQQGDHNLMDFYTPLSRKVVLEETMPTLLAEGWWVGELAVRNAEGRTIPISQVGIGHRSAEGTFQFISGIARDISDQKKLEHMLEVRAREAESAAATKAAFLANMSHEIRTPMNGVLGMLQLLAATELTDEQRDFLRTAASSGEALLVIINDVLDFSKIEAGKLTLDVQPFDLLSLARDLVQLLQPDAGRKGIDLRLDYREPAPGLLLGDAARIRQIVLNLLGNATKFTESGSVTLRVTGKEGKAGKVDLTLAVEDTGIGIPEDRLASIFEDFEQADSSLTRRFGGTGLGLAISSRLAELMNGRLTVTSTVNVGSTFTLSLPLKLAGDLQVDSSLGRMTALAGSATTTETAEPSGGVQRPEEPAARALDCLVVEDNLVNQKVAVAMLQRLGCRVTVAGDGREALDVLEASSFDVIFMDCQMPVMDGFEATGEIRERENASRHRTPIVAMTANSVEGDREKCLAAGMDDYISKPVDLDELRSTLDRTFAST